MNLETLPDNLPVPEDDGAVDHLITMCMPDVTLNSTGHEKISLGKLSGFTVIFIYPMTGRPDTDLPDNWDHIPGARGCTPQSCAFRDLHDELKQYASIYGLSSQSTEYQLEAKRRLHLHFELLSDETFHLKQLLCLPTFVHQGIERYKRITLILKDTHIQHVFYPVFPPENNAMNVLTWLKNQQ